MTRSFAACWASHRWRFIAVVLAAMAALAPFLMDMGLDWFPSSRLKAGNFTRIRPGLTREQVERFLGGPPGDYGRYADGVLDFGDGSVLQVFAVPSVGRVKGETWEDDRNRFTIFFDSRKVVVAASKATQVRRRRASWSLDKAKQVLLSMFR
jgi:hypothetical protein